MTVVLNDPWKALLFASCGIFSGRLPREYAILNICSRNRHIPLRRVVSNILNRPITIDTCRHLEISYNFITWSILEEIENLNEISSEFVLRQAARKIILDELIDRWLTRPKASTRAENFLLDPEKNIVATAGELAEFFEIREHNTNELVSINKTVIHCHRMDVCAAKVINVLVKNSPCDVACKDLLWNEIKKHWRSAKPFPEEKRATLDALNITLDHFRRLAMFFLYKVRHRDSYYDLLDDLLFLVLPTIEEKPTKALFWELNAHNWESLPRVMPGEALLDSHTAWPSDFADFLRSLSGTVWGLEHLIREINSNGFGDVLNATTLDAIAFRRISFEKPSHVALLDSMMENIHRVVYREIMQKENEFIDSCTSFDACRQYIVTRCEDILARVEARLLVVEAKLEEFKDKRNRTITESLRSKKSEILNVLAPIISRGIQHATESLEVERDLLEKILSNTRIKLED